MCNQEIRKVIKDSKVRYWQVADALEIAPNTLTLWLRHELEPDKKQLVMDAIERCKADQRKEG